MVILMRKVFVNRCSSGAVQRRCDDVLRLLGQLHDEGQHERQHHSYGT